VKGGNTLSGGLAKVITGGSLSYFLLPVNNDTGKRERERDNMGWRQRVLE
jgi:hypothetical protein